MFLLIVCKFICVITERKFKMKNLIMKSICLVIVVFASPVFSAVIESPIQILSVDSPELEVPSEPSGGGSGGGGSSSSYPQRLNESISLPGLFNLNAYAENYANRTSAHLQGRFMADNLKFRAGNISFNRFECNPEEFQISANVEFEVLDISYSDYSIDFEEYSSINLQNFEINSWLRVENYEEWFWNDTNDEPEYVITDDIEISYGLNLEPFDDYSEIVITSINLNVNEWYNDWEDKNILYADFNGHGYCHSPEPVSIGLLCVGSLALFKRRRKIC